MLNLEPIPPRDQDGRRCRMHCGISKPPSVLTGLPFNPQPCLLQQILTMPAFLGWTPLRRQPCLRHSMAFYCPTTSGGPSETQHTFSSSSRYSVQVSCSTPLRIWRSQETDRSLSVRVTAFVMRAVLAGSHSAGTDLNLVIGELVVYSVGFFGLLYSAYTLVLDR